MTYKNIFKVIIAIICFFDVALAQNRKSNIIVPLIKEQSIPQDLWQAPISIIKLSGEEIKTSLQTYKGRVIILDFWATWCGSCLKHFPELNSLQERYKNNLKIVLVNSYNSGDTKAKILRVLRMKNKELVSGLKLSCIVNDSVLANTFPHNFLPHLVWIGKDGVIRAITSAEEVTQKNIDMLLTSDSLITYGKKDEPTDELLYTNENLPQKKLQQYSILLKGKIDGLGGGARPRKINDTIRGMVFSNRTLLTLYKMTATKLIKDFSSKQIVLKVRDSSIFIEPESNLFTEDWQRKNLYSLDLVVPYGKFPNFYEYMLGYLNLYSGYKGVIKKKDLNCWILKRKDVDMLFANKGGPYINTLFEHEKILKSAPIKDLCEWLTTMTGSNEPVIDQTGYTKLIDINFDKKKSNNLNEVKSQLDKWGFELVPAIRNIDVLLITDN